MDIKTFLDGVSQNAARVRKYQMGGDGSGGLCDCIGLVIGAIRLAGEKWTGTHGSNYAARSEMRSLSDAQWLYVNGHLKAGMVIYKAYDKGDSRNALPDTYSGSADQHDYYHVGVVIRENPLRIIHCTGVEGGIKYDSDLGAWRFAGWLNKVSEEGGEQEMNVDYDATVYAPGGGTVRMRRDASTGAEIIKNIAVGTVVHVVQEVDDTWAKIESGGVSGYMMREFLVEGCTEPEDGDEITITLKRSTAQELYAALRNVLEE